MMVRPPTLSVGGSLNMLEGTKSPLSMTAAAVNDLMVEPGSYISVTGRLRVRCGTAF